MKASAFALAVRAETTTKPVSLRPGWHWLPLLAAFVPLLAACTPSTVGGVRGETAFAATARVESHDSELPVDKVFACFRADARFLPYSHFTTSADGSSRYTLAGHGLWFEDFVFTPAGSGSHVEIRTSGAYDAKWVTMLVRDRLEPLGVCLKPPVAQDIRP